MSNLILHKDGAYNLYSTIADGAYYEHALTLDELHEAIRFEQGQAGVDQLPARLKRAHATGCSSLVRETLAGCIKCNRAGLGERCMPFDEFVSKYLTLPAPLASESK